MNIDNILIFLGESITNQNLKAEFASIGVDVDYLSLPEGDYSSYIEKPLKGFSLIFTDEAKFLNIEKQPIGKGPLHFTGIFLYSEGKDGYSQFSSKIPKGILFSDSIGDIHRKLGEPIWNRKRSDDTVIAEKWDFPEFVIHITYSKETHLPILISINKPDL
jgi:hypothetical protein